MEEIALLSAHKSAVPRTLVLDGAGNSLSPNLPRSVLYDSKQEAGGTKSSLCNFYWVSFLAPVNLESVLQALLEVGRVGDRVPRLTIAAEKASLSANSFDRNPSL